MPSQHDLGCTVVTGRDVTGHLRVLDSSKTKVANLEITVFVDENVGRLEVTVDDTGRVDVFETALGVSARKEGRRTRIWYRKY